MPGNSAPRLTPITSSIGTKCSGRPAGTQRGSDFGTFTRAKCSAPVCGSRTRTASDSDRFEMYGNGCPGSTASGVSTGNTCDSKNCIHHQPLGRRQVVHPHQPHAVLRERRQQVVVQAACAAAASSSLTRFSIACSCSAGDSRSCG